MNAAKALKDRGAKEVYVYITHGVLSGEAVKKIKNSVIKNLVITDTIDNSDKIKGTKNIEDLSIGLDFVNTLRPRKFTWANRQPNKLDGRTETGFIAQELQSAEGSIDYLHLVYDVNPEKLEASQGKLIPVLTKAIQELSEKNDALEARLAALEGS